MKQNNRDIWKIKFQTNFDHWHEVSSYGTLDSDVVEKRAALLIYLSPLLLRPNLVMYNRREKTFTIKFLKSAADSFFHHWLLHIALSIRTLALVLSSCVILYHHAS